MNKKQAATALGISVRSLERRMRTGRVKFAKTGEGPFAEVSFTRADLGLGEPETPPLAAVSSRDLPKGDTTAPPATAAPPPDDLEEWSTGELQAGIAVWAKPDNPNGTPSNAPAIGSSTMPSPANFGRFTRANAILLARSLSGFIPGRARSVHAFSAPSVMCEGSVNQYRPHTGFGVTEADLKAESDLLKAYPQFARNLYTR